MLRNEKYIGVSVVNVGGEEGQIYKLNNSHPAIISKEMFDVVQKEKLKRSNVELTDDEAIKKMNIIIDRLDEDEDVQQVYHNWDE